MGTVVLTETAVVEIGNVAEVVPAPTVTEAGTDAAAFRLANVTVTSAAGAVFKVTVPVVDAPPVTLAGEADTPVSHKPPAGLTVTLALADLPLAAAVITAAVGTPTVPPTMVNWTDVFPAGTVTCAWTAATFAWLEVRVTTVLLGAAAARVTVPFTLVPPTTGVGADTLLTGGSQNGLTAATTLASARP